jgi:cobalt-zinc-cadmium efflux system protein
MSQALPADAEPRRPAEDHRPPPGEARGERLRPRHHEHPHGARSGRADRRWLLAALAVIAAFMIGEVIAGLLANSLALLSDAGHMLTDATALLVAIVASRIAERPPKGAYTYGFARVDALAGQANGITLVLLALWFTAEAVRRLIAPPNAEGAVIVVVAAIGIVVNVVATALAVRANKRSLNIRGAITHLVNDIWAFIATLVAGIAIIATGWTRADAVASLVVAALMIVTGVALIRAAGRVFLEAAPAGMDPMLIGSDLAARRGVAQVHDLHVWELAAGEAALSAHVLVDRADDCHVIGDALRAQLADGYGIDHVTLQVDHVSDGGDHCPDAHGPVHTTEANETSRPGV